IQLHPDRAQAEAGFAAEEARGVPRGARERVYVDDWPKPEVLCALTPFEVLAGLRPATAAAEILAGLGVGALDGLGGGPRGRRGRPRRRGAVAVPGRLRGDRPDGGRPPRRPRPGLLAADEPRGRPA